MKQKFLDTLKKYQMLPTGSTVYVGVSGGSDSIALFHILFSLKKELGLKEVGIFHVNHLLRDEEAEKDQEFVETFAKQLKAPYILGKVNVRDIQRNYRYSLEEAARIGRFQYFRREAKRRGITTIALGHTLDDQAETVLMRMIRGAGLKGFQAIRPVLKYPETSFIRPLIELEKEEVIRYLKQENLTYRIDSSNYSTRFMRNRVRLELMPEIEKNYNPRIKQVLARLPESIGMDVSFLDEITEQQFDRCIKNSDKEDEVLLKKNIIEDLPQAIQYRVFQKAISMVEPKVDLDYFHWSQIRKGIVDKTHFQISLPQDLVVTFERKEIQVNKKLVEEIPQYQYQLKKGEKILVKEMNLNFGAELFEKRIYKVKKDDRRYEIFDYDKLKFPLTIRNRRKGDVFQSLGMEGKKKLKDFFIDKKVSARDKAYLPLIISAGKIIWVYGLGIAEHCCVTSKTKRFLKLSSFEPYTAKRTYSNKRPSNRRGSYQGQRRNNSDRQGYRRKESTPKTSAPTKPKP